MYAKRCYRIGATVMLSHNLLLRIVTLLLFCAWEFYFLITEKRANKEKTPTKLSTLKSRFERYFFGVGEGSLVIFQLLGLTLFPFPYNVFSQTLGFLLVILGVGISLSARRVLGTNWTHAVDYQIKEKHVLITT